MNENISVPRVLIVDDELLQRKVVTAQLQRLNFICESAATGAEALEILQTKDFDVVLLDVQMDDISGLDVLPQIKILEDAPEVVMLTLDKSLESGITAMRAGAYDYLTKPIAANALDVIINKAAEKRKLVRQNLTLRDFVESKTHPSFGDTKIIETSLAMRQIIEQAKSVARINSTILITGESGTGKDVLARYIHQQSKRAKSTLVTVNCGAMPEALFESEFFGYEKGAFSGANQTKRGLIEVADGATLFLDEIGEMSLGLQVKLLRFLESGEFRRVGGTRNLFSDARLIAATNQNLEQAIKDSRFRADLFYRLNVIQFQLPPLCKRTEDMPALIDYFVDFYRNQFNKPNLKLAASARQKLKNYNFPGNIRELKNTIERAAALALQGTIESEHIFFHPPTNGEQPTSSLSLKSTDNLALTNNPLNSIFPTDNKIIELGELERHYILAVLAHTGGNREQAASVLGISERTLYRRLRDYE